MKLKKAISKPKVVDIRDTLDYTRSTSIFFSGVEDSANRDMLYDLGVRDFLVSYQYLNPRTISEFRRLDGIRLFVDSGAFTYITNPEYEDYTVPQWEAQIKEYCEFVRRNKDLIFAVADLDLQLRVGYDTVKAWRKKYFEPLMLETGVPVCMIYHGEGLDEFKLQCERYPYVGVSGSTQDWSEDQYREFIRIAEKYNTVVHGMGMTSIPALSRLPLYSCDSTSYLVGAQYGEVNVIDSGGFRRIKKADIPNKAIPVIERYPHKFDVDKILESDGKELTRVNAYAFLLAQDWVRERLRGMMYWQKAKTVKVDLNNLPDNFFPAPEWKDSDRSDWSELAKRYNINPDYDRASDIVYDCIAFMTWRDTDYAEFRDVYDDELIETIHSFYVNRVAADTDSRIDDLIAFFRSIVSGESDKLLLIGTNFDRTVAERDSYIEEDEFEEVAISKDEVRQRLSNILALPEKADDGADIDSLDDEIFENLGMTPARDKQGRLIAASIKARKMKKIYSDKYPKLACDTCYAAQRCEQYKSGSACAFSKMFNRFDTRNLEDIKDAMYGMVNHNLSRMQRAMVVEQMTGVVDSSVTGFIQQNMQLLDKLAKINEVTPIVRQTRVLTPDGVQTMSTEIRNPQSGGILEKLFMQSGKTYEE